MAAYFLLDLFEEKVTRTRPSVFRDRTRVLEMVLFWKRSSLSNTKIYIAAITNLKSLRLNGKPYININWKLEVLLKHKPASQTVNFHHLRTCIIVDQQNENCNNGLGLGYDKDDFNDIHNTIWHDVWLYTWDGMRHVNHAHCSVVSLSLSTGLMPVWTSLLFM